MKLKYTKELLHEAVQNSVSYTAVLRYMGIKQTGGNQSYIKQRIDSFGIDVSHFKGQSWSKGLRLKTKRKTEDILVLRETGTRQKSKFLTRALIDSGIEHKCDKCGQLPEWLGNPLTLDVDHINRNWLDDRLDNLRFLCPNCHSQFSRNLIKN